MQGISPIKPLFAKIRLENICKFSRIREIPYAKSQGIILREQGNNSAFWTGTGIWRKIDPRSRPISFHQSASTSWIRQ
jgi:hypothetical protein